MTDEASGDKVECERKAKELAAKYKAELAAREDAARQKRNAAKSRNKKPPKNGIIRP